MKIPIKHHIKRLQGDAADLGKWAKPQRTRITDDGDTVIERIPSMPSCLMLKPAGHTAWVPLANGMGRFNPSDPYYLQISQEKIRKGFLPVAMCPKSIGATHWLPKEIRNTPACTKSADGGRIDEEHPCSCILATKEMREKRQAAVTEEIAARHRTREARDADLREKQIKQSGHALDRIADLLEAQGAKRKKPL